MTFKDGVATFTLKDGASKTATGLPAGTTYEVTEAEANQDGYDTTSEGAAGTIVKEQTAKAEFTNTKYIPRGSLTVSKTVAGDGGDKAKDFHFTVTLSDKTISGKFGDMEFTDGVATFTLQHGESKTAENLPANVVYTVTEIEANSEGYTTMSTDAGGTITADGTAVAAFVNTKNGGGTDPDPTPDPDPEDPDKPELNTEDHYAYIVGYPDGNVKPEGNITRAEVATIFFRLLTDESRDEFWSQTNPYSDVSEDDWYNNAVSTLTNAGIIDGYEDGTFKPNGNITRAEFATIAVRFFEATYEGENLFPDIDGHWAQDYINEAANAGIVDGYPDGTFGPQKLITRAEAMTMVNRTIDRHPHKDHLLEDMIVWPDNPETAWYYEQVQEATNSHEYTMNTDDEQNPYEIWTELLPVRDWEQLEKEWSDAHSGQSGGDVV